MASLFTMLALPLLIYAYMFIYRIVKDKNEKNNHFFLINYLLIRYYINSKSYCY